jgi:hypothetical protein
MTANGRKLPRAVHNVIAASDPNQTFVRLVVCGNLDRKRRGELSYGLVNSRLGSGRGVCKFNSRDGDSNLSSCPNETHLPGSLVIARFGTLAK